MRFSNLHPDCRRSVRIAALRPWRVLLLCSLLPCSPQAILRANEAPQATVEFNRDIRPILADKCFACHGPDVGERQAELRLDLRDAALADRDGAAAIVPGDPEQSLLVDRIASDDPHVVMPPPDSKRGRLSADQIETIRRWIRTGAPYEGHWALEPLRDVAPGESDSGNPIDWFVDRKLRALGIRASDRATRAVQLRRVYLDLIGLLPTPAETAAFVADERPDAWKRVVEGLLASPHYGERWGRHWLDHARYADSHGYSIDGERTMWPYRDWVIDALNRDMPFDQFTIEQLAGDLLPEATKPQRVASAFHRNTLINQEGGTDDEQFRVESVVDRVNTTGQVWLGLTVGCAQCHTHKYDPITQREYYQLFAFFNSTKDINNVGPTVKVAVGKLFGDEPAEDAPTGRVMVMEELDQPRTTYLLSRGDFTQPDVAAGELEPGVLSCVSPPLPDNGRRLTRLDLARWLVDPANPLTPRVTVNRVWMRYFGRGLVETENDFGVQGALPTHPDLLDYLARQFVAEGWSQKWLHRQIVTSETYRRSSHARPDLAEIDPRNLYLARQSRLRLDAEMVRDAALSASGLLTTTIGGPSVYPPQPDGVYAFTQTAKDWKTSTGQDRFRRTMYTFFYRSAPHPFLTAFDVPDFQTTCTRRVRSNTPLQALTMTNDPAMQEIAAGLAGRIIEEGPEEVEQRLRYGFLLTVCREPEPAELSLLAEHFRRQETAWQRSPKSAQAILPERLVEKREPLASTAALMQTARLLLNTDNFITRE